MEGGRGKLMEGGRKGEGDGGREGGRKRMDGSIDGWIVG